MGTLRKTMGQASILIAKTSDVTVKSSHLTVQGPRANRPVGRATSAMPLARRVRFLSSARHKQNLKPQPPNQSKIPRCLRASKRDTSQPRTTMPQQKMRQEVNQKPSTSAACLKVLLFSIVSFWVSNEGRNSPNGCIAVSVLD